MTNRHDVDTVITCNVSCANWPRSWAAAAAVRDFPDITNPRLAVTMVYAPMIWFGQPSRPGANPW